MPVFGLIFAGWLSGRLGALGPNAAEEINRFVVWLALPALLFDVISGSTSEALWQPEFIATFALSGLICLGVATVICFHRVPDLAGAAINGLNAAYSNIGFVGFPILLSALGKDALIPATIGSIITMCVIFAFVIVIIEAAGQKAKGAGILDLVAKIGRTLAGNPILLASAIAAVFPVSGATLPAPARDFVHLLGQAASPCALVALGLFLSKRKQTEHTHTAAVIFLATCKLVLHPFLAFLFAKELFGLSHFSTSAVVLLAALPTGTGSFMLAAYYGKDPVISSRAIILTTFVSVVSITTWLTILSP